MKAKTCGGMTIVPVASGLLYTPEDDVLFDHPINLSLEADARVFPSQN